MSTAARLPILTLLLTSVAMYAGARSQSTGPKSAQKNEQASAAAELFSHAVEQIKLPTPGAPPLAYRMSIALTTETKVQLTGHFLYAWSSPQEWVRILVVPPIAFSEGMHGGKSWLYISSGAAIPIAIQAQYILCPWCLFEPGGKQFKKPENKKIAAAWLTCVSEPQTDMQACFDPENGLPTYADAKNWYRTEFSSFKAWSGHQFPGEIYSTGKHLGRIAAKLEMLGTLADAQLGPDIFQPPTGARAWDFCEPPDVELPPKLIHQAVPALPSSVPRPADVTVTIHGIVGTDGVLRDAVITPTGWPAMDHNAIDAIQQWRYKPATCNGRLIPTFGASWTIEVQSQ